jgi:hypothetical protein
VLDGKVSNRDIRNLSYGPQKKVSTYNGIIVNGYRFHTEEYGRNKSTMNSGICVRGSFYGENELDYYGIIEQIIELSYLGNMNVFILRCRWFDPVHGVKADGTYGLIDVKHRSKLHSNEPFVLAEQAQQVYYTKYPSTKKSVDEWWAACKVKNRLFFEENLRVEGAMDDDIPRAEYYQDDETSRVVNLGHEYEITTLLDTDGPMEEVDINELRHHTEVDDDQFINDNDTTEQESVESEDEIDESLSSS